MAEALAMPLPGQPMEQYISNSLTDDEPEREPIRRRILDSFKRDPSAHITNPVAGGYNEFDMEAATVASGGSQLKRKLKSRHLQMIAIGGSVGAHSPSLSP